MNRPCFAIVLASGFVLSAAAAAGQIRATDAWSRPAAAGLPTGVAYLVLTNDGSAPDRLVGASSPKAAEIGLHRSAMSHGVMNMAPVVDGLTLPPGRAVSLAPNGYHLMLVGLKGGLTPKATYPLTLRFAHAKPVTIRVQVRLGPNPMAVMAR